MRSWMNIGRNFYGKVNRLLMFVNYFLGYFLQVYTYAYTFNTHSSHKYAASHLSNRCKVFFIILFCYFAKDGNSVKNEVLEVATTTGGNNKG